jgi:hypothetical protein
VLFTWKCIKIIFFYLKKIFLISAHQNNLKTLKNNNLKQRKNKKKIYKSAFEMQKQTGFYETQLKKHVKIASQKLHFKLNFLVGLTV